MSEEWRPAPGFEGRYEVSSQGRVRGIDRVVTRRGQGQLKVKGVVLKPVLSGRGDYLTVSLKVDGRCLTRYIHRLVAEAFLGSCPDGLECCHDNGDGHDNRLANLRWGTHSSNVRDTVRHGRHNNAAKSRCKRDHEFTPENTYAWTDPKTGRTGRQCIACRVSRAA